MIHTLRLIAICALLPSICGGCARESPRRGYPSQCLALFPSFCLNDSLAQYKVTLEERAFDLHGYEYVFVGQDKQSDEVLFVASVSDSGNPSEFNVLEEPGVCRIHGRMIKECVRRTWISDYETILKGLEALNRRGISVNLAASRSVVSSLDALATACYTTNTGDTLCQLNLPPCYVRASSSGCIVEPASN